MDLVTFKVTLSTASATPVLVDYTTVDETAVGYRDYIVAVGTLTFAPGDTERSIVVRVVGSRASAQSRKFSFVLSNARAADLGMPHDVECVISGPPPYAAVPFPGRRLAALGDSITYANNHWNPPSTVTTDDAGKPGKSRNEYYSTGMTGFISYANQILDNAFSLQPALQPNTQPGANATSPKNGYNFAVYSSRVDQWMSADFDPAPIPPTTSHNVGPMLAALNYLDHFDLAVILGGTNDLAQNTKSGAILANLMSYALQLAQAGKWVFLCTLTPRTADMLQMSPSGAGYSQSEIAGIMQTLLAVNAGLRDWLTPGPHKDLPANIFLVDAWDELVGPTPSILSVPTDPAGMLSPSSGIVKGENHPSVPGNYRTDAPGLRYMYDGLHMAPPAAYVLGRALAASMSLAGVPDSPSRNEEGGSAAGVGKLTFGPNLMANKTFARGTTADRAPGSGLVLGRAIGLGPPNPNSGFGSITAGVNKDTYTNQGSGYANGPVPDRWFVYRASNADNESFSNFNGYTYIALNSQANPAPLSYQANSTWADGCLHTAVTSETFDLGGTSYVNEPGFALTFARAAGVIGADTAKNNCAFIAKYLVAEGQHGPWDNYGFEVFPQAAWPSPPYAPGDKLMLDCILKFEGLSPNLQSCRVVANFLGVDFTNGNSNAAIISSIAQGESFFPFVNIKNCHHHTEDRYMAVRTPIITAPTPASGETAVYAQLIWQFSFDCETVAAAGTITIIKPQFRKVTVPAGGL